MKRLLLLLHTLRYLKTKQLVYRVFYHFRKPRLNNLPEPEIRGVLSTWSGAAFFHPATDDGRAFTFLGETGDLRKGWNNPYFSKLWLYNLHYQDDLNSIGVGGRLALCQQLVENWITANPPLHGNGWEPYCLSLRIVNWVKWLSRLHPDEIDPLWLRSLACQADALEQQLEFHILANHLFANAKALVFVGSFLGGRQGNAWLKKGLDLLDQEVAEQFLDDGGHYELSPMYHASLVWDMCDLLQLQQQTRLGVLDERENVWRRVIEQGISWLRKMVHPDGDIAFFNDATLGVAPTIKQLEVYAEQLSCLPVNAVASADSLLQLHNLKTSGYLVIDWSDQHRALLDAAQVGPDYQPGHAHADTLSFELSLFGQRVIVNSGISQYGDDAERHRQRSTAAHNTLEVDGENSSEVWAGFRVARRARSYGVEFLTSNGQVSITASHDGYHRLPGKVTHQRHWLAEPSSLTITDTVTGHYNLAIVHWHFHPEIKIKILDSQRLQLYLPKGQNIVLHISGAKVRLLESTWHPGFGLSIRNHKLELKLVASKVITRIEWSSI